MTNEMREAVARAGHAAVQKLLAEYDADLNRPVSQAECDRAFADAAIAAIWPIAMERAAGAVEQKAVALGRPECCGFGVGGSVSSPPECCDDPNYVISDREAAAAIRALTMENDRG